MKRIAKFYKVSEEQFAADWQEIFGDGGGLSHLLYVVLGIGNLYVRDFS